VIVSQSTSVQVETPNATKEDVELVLEVVDQVQVADSEFGKDVFRIGLDENLKWEVDYRNPQFG